MYKKADPQDVSNYRPISLLSVISKVMERIIHKYMFNFYRETDFITPFQSGFIPKDSTVNQLLSLYHSICLALDEGKEIRAVFCDVSKAFDRVWHEGLLFKLHRSRIQGRLFQWLSDYLSDRRQRVVLSGAMSDIVSIKAGVPQGSILGPLLFLVYINDIVSDINSPIRLFADDTTLYIVVDDPQRAADALNSDLDQIQSWANKWLVTFNPMKTESLLFSRKTTQPTHPNIYMNNVQINEVSTHKHLGVVFSKNCSWHEHIVLTMKKAWQRIYIMRSFKFTLDRRSLEIFYFSFIRPVLEYADVVWDNLTQSDEEELEKIQLKAARIISGTTKLVSVSNLYSETCIEPLRVRRKSHRLILFYKMYHSLVPRQVGDRTTYYLRNSSDLRNISCRT